MLFPAVPLLTTLSKYSKPDCAASSMQIFICQVGSSSLYIVCLNKSLLLENTRSFITIDFPVDFIRKVHLIKVYSDNKSYFGMVTQFTFSIMKGVVADYRRVL